MKDSKKKYGTKKQVLLVNLITGLRFVASFSIIPLFQTLGGFAAAIFAGVFFATDWIDGFLARKFNVSTFFGSMFDGASDKAFGMTIFALLMTVNPVVFSIPLLIELGIIFAQGKKMKKGLNVKSNMIGKVKTGFLSVTSVLSFLVADLLNLPQFIEYIKTASLAEVANIKNTLILLGVNIPTIVMQILTLRGYSKEAEEEVVLEEEKEFIKHEEIQDPESRIRNIQEERLLLQKEYSLLEKIQKFNGILFDPEFYDQNKDEKLADVTRKLFKKNEKNKI